MKTIVPEANFWLEMQMDQKRKSINKQMCSFLGFVALISVLAIIFLAGCTSPMTTREKGAGIGALGGAAVGGILGATVGHPGAGAAIGGALGLGAGAVVGDQMQSGESQQQVIDRQQQQIERQRKQIECLKRENPQNCGIH